MMFSGVVPGYHFLFIHQYRMQHGLFVQYEDVRNLPKFILLDIFFHVLLGRFHNSYLFIDLGMSSEDYYLFFSFSSHSL